MKHPICLLLFFYLPTIYLQIYAARSLLKLESSISSLTVFSLCQGLIMFLVRDVLGLFGPHVVILLITHIGLQKLIFKSRMLPEGIMVAVLPLVLAMMGELTFVPVVLALLGYTMTDVLNQLYLFVFIGWISNLPVIAIALNMTLTAGRELTRCI